MADDPWTSVKDEVVQSLRQANTLFQRWQQLVDGLAQGGSKDDLERVEKELNTSLKSIGWDLEDLNETVSLVESNPGRFKIGGQEMAQRKQFIKETTKTVSDIRNHLSSSEAKAKVAAGARKSLLGGGGASSRYAKLESEIASSNDAFIQDQGQKQELIMREQDTQLEEVASTMGALKEMGAAIGDELEDQNRLLDEIDLEMDSTSEKLKRTIAKVDKVLAISKDGKQSCAICLLIIVLIILIIVWAG